MTLIGFGPNMPQAPFVAVPREEAKKTRENLDSIGLLDTQFKPREEDDCILFPLYEGDEEAWFEYAITRTDPHIRLREIFPNGPVPKKWERLGDLVLFPLDSFGQREQPPWSDVVQALGAKRIGYQAPIKKSVNRTSQAVLLHGSQGNVTFQENHVTFCFDPFSVMFSSGNLTERKRMASLDTKNEVIIDAYAGIGYYTLPLLVHGDVKHVHALEMTPKSLEGLSLGLEMNQVHDRCTIHAGDNKDTLPLLEGVADRVVLGLLPSSEASWKLAARSLKPSGGCIHVHMNIHENQFANWPEETKKQFEVYGNWNVFIEHFEKVKSYSPGIWHVVLDLKFRSKN